MQQYFDVVQNQSGKAISGATVSVYDSTNSLAIIYSDNGVARKGNPFTSDIDGEYYFYAANGRYKVIISASDFVSDSKQGIVLFDPTDKSALSDLAYTSSGIGAVATNVQAKLQETVSVKDFGAIGDGLSHPASTKYPSLAAMQIDYPFATSLYQELDYLGWQAALNNGGSIVSQPLKYVMCNTNSASMSPLTVISGKSWVNANGATLDFSKMAATTAISHNVANYNFVTSSNWSNSPVYSGTLLNPAVFGSGAATMTDSLTCNSFYQWGQQVTLAPGKYTATCTYSATLGVTYSHGNVNPPYCNIQFFGSNPGVGASGISGSAAKTGLIGVITGTLTGTLSFDFIVTSTKTAWLTFTAGGYGNFTVTNMDINNINLNTAVLATRDGTSLHYPIMQPIDGIYLIGPGSSSGIVGLTYGSFSNTDGNVSKLSNSVITNFGTGISFRSGAYLVETEDVQIFANGLGVSYPASQFNAGENLRFVGGGIYNNTIGISNLGSGEMSFIQTAIDYNNQAVVNNSGRIEFHGVHIEQNMPTTANTPIFQCINNGTILWFGGMFLGAGSVGSTPSPPVHLDSVNSGITFYGTELYNFSSASGVMADGLGIVQAFGWLNTGNPNIGLSIISSAPNMDVLGGAGTFEPVTPSILGSNSNISIVGGIYPYAGGTTNSQYDTQYLQAAVSTAYAKTGTSSLAVTKSPYGPGYGGQLAMCIPILRGQQNVWGQMSFLFPTASGSGTGTNVVYYRLFWVRVYGYDSYNRPRFAPTTLFKGEFDITFDQAGSSVWQTRTINTQYTGGATAGVAPQWATHLAVLLDTQSIEPTTFYIDDFSANVL